MIILITGGANGVGKELSKYLKKKNKVYELGSKNKNKKNYIKCDLNNLDDIEKLSAKIPKLDILINNAGTSFRSQNNFKNFKEIININLCAPFYLSSLLLDKLKKSKRPSIINISSINSHIAFPGNPGYVSSKGGLNALTRSLALDYSKYKIRVNSISPGYINCGMTQKSYKNKILRKQREDRTMLGRWGKPRDLFGIIDYLISSKSLYVTGQDFVIDGGWVTKGL